MEQAWDCTGPSRGAEFESCVKQGSEGVFVKEQSSLVNHMCPCHRRPRPGILRTRGDNDHSTTNRHDDDPTNRYYNTPTNYDHRPGDASIWRHHHQELRDGCDSSR